MEEVKCKQCQLPKKIRARGYCNDCYFEFSGKKQKGTCSDCGNMRVLCRGMCSTCYNKFRQSPSFRAIQEDKKKNILCINCKIGKVYSKERCSACYNHFRMHGTERPLTKRVSDREKAVIALHAKQEMTFEQIGSELGITKQAAHQIYQRAVRKMATNAVLEKALAQ